MSATITAPLLSTARHPLAYIRESLTALERDTSHLQAWATRHPCLTGVHSTGELIEITHQGMRGQGANPSADLSRADTIFRAVIREHLAGDAQATMTCLLMLYPMLAHYVSAAEEDLACDLVAAALAALPKAHTSPAPSPP